MKKGFGRGVCFGRWRSGTRKEKVNRRNKKSEFSLLYYRVVCIIRLEKKNQNLCSLFLCIGASLLNVIY